MSVATENPRTGGGRRRRFAKSATLIAIALLGILGTRAILLETNPPEPLRLSINAWPGYEFAMLAQELGYYEQENVDVRFFEFSTLSDARRAFEHDQTHGFFGTVVELVEARNHTRRNPVPVLACNFSDGADVIVARPGIESVPDLRGKRVAVERDSLNIYVLGRALEQAGLNWDSVEPVYIAGVDMPDALRTGFVDAAVTYPPISIEINNAGSGRVIYTTKQIPGEVLDVLSVAQDVAESRSEDIDSFVRAYFRAVEFALENPDDAFPIMAARLRITPEEFAEALESGIQLISASEQPEYLMPGGIFDQVVSHTERIMAHSHSHPHTLHSTDAAFPSASAERDD